MLSVKKLEKNRQVRLLGGSTAGGSILEAADGRCAFNPLQQAPVAQARRAMQAGAVATALQTAAPPLLGLSSGIAWKPLIAWRQKGHWGAAWSCEAHRRRAQPKQRSCWQPATCGGEEGAHGGCAKG